MRIIDFKESNIVFAESQQEYKNLSAHHDKNTGIVTSCWKANFIDRLIILFTGRIWLQLMTFNKPIMPQLLSAQKVLEGKE